MIGSDPRRARRADDPRPQARRLGLELDRARVRLLALQRGHRWQALRARRDVFLLDPDIEAESSPSSGSTPIRPAPRSSLRDRHAAFLVTAIAVIGGSLERLTTEIRNLQHTEIARGHRAVQGRPDRLARRCRTSATRSPPSASPAWRGCCAATPRPAFEDQALWHERDISHSSVERVALPDATMLARLHAVTIDQPRRRARVRADRMAENIEHGLGLHASIRVLLALVTRAVEPRRPIARPT